MKTRVLPADSEQSREAACHLLQRGKPIVLPTDTVYGLGCLVFDARAILRLFEIKQRPLEKAIPILVGNLEGLEGVSADIPRMALRLAEQFWPGPLTLVVPRHPSLPDCLSKDNSVGVRLPNHPDARALLLLTGPMAVTSANLSGKENPLSAREVLSQLGGKIALILDGGKSPGGIPSTVVNCMGNEPMIIRQGAITEAQVMTSLGKAKSFPQSNRL